MEKKEKEFTPRNPQAFDTACRLFAGGALRRQIAEDLKMRPSTIWNWSKQDEWKRKVAEYQENLPPKVVQPRKIRKVKEFKIACELEGRGGITPDKIAAAVGVSVATITSWRSEPEWQAAVDAYKANREQSQPEAGDKEIDDITLQFLRTLSLRDLKNFCIALKRNIEYQREIQAIQAAERARGDLGILQKLDDFCGNKDFSATQLRDAWSDRLKPPDDKDDKDDKPD